MHLHLVSLFSGGKGHGTLSSQRLLHAVNPPSPLISAHGTGFVHYLAKGGGPRGSFQTQKKSIKYFKGEVVNE